MEINLIPSVHKQKLTPDEYKRSVEQLMKYEGHKTYEDVAKAIGITLQELLKRCGL